MIQTAKEKEKLADIFIFVQFIHRCDSDYPARYSGIRQAIHTFKLVSNVFRALRKIELTSSNKLSNIYFKI